MGFAAALWISPLSRLAAHLPVEQGVVFEQGEELDTLANAAAKGTTLTAWSARLLPTVA